MKYFKIVGSGDRIVKACNEENLEILEIAKLGASFEALCVKGAKGALRYVRSANHTKMLREIEDNKESIVKVVMSPQEWNYFITKEQEKAPKKSTKKPKKDE